MSAASRPGSPRKAGARKLFLVDGTALVFRAHFAFMRRPLTTSDGLHVGALFGFLNTLLALIRDAGADRLAVAFDTAAPTFRHERYPEYKANRPEMPAELVAQMPYLEPLVDALGLASFRQEGIEADDVIGSLTAQARAEGWEVVIVSADKDFSQLIAPGVRQFVPPRGREAERWVDADAVRERFGVRPEQFIDFLALTGDSSDNIPGVKGIGPKTAATLLQAHGSLDRIYAQIEEVEPRGVREKLRRERDAAYLSRELVTIVTDRVRANLESLEVPDPVTRPQLRELLASLEFDQLIGRIFGDEAQNEAGRSAATAADACPLPPVSRAGAQRARQGSLLDGLGGDAALAAQGAGAGEEGGEGEIRIADGWARDYCIAATVSRLADALARYDPAGGPLGIDTESSTLDPRSAELVGLSFGWRPGEAWYVPLGHRRGANLPVAALRAQLGPLLADEQIAKVGQNLGFDLHLLRRAGLDVRGPLRDTMIAAYLCDPEARYGLDALARARLGHEMVPITRLIGRGRDQISMAELPIEVVAPYACEDVDAVVRLWPLLADDLEQRAAGPLFRDVEMPLLPILVAMEEAGIGLDVTVLEEISAGLGAELAARESQIQQLAGEHFNVNSPKQLQEILFTKLRLRPRRRTKTGYSTRQEVLEELIEAHPLPRAILDYRQLAKLLSTYVDVLPRLVDSRSGRIHARFHQTIAATGRLSSSHPNLQNIPIRTKRGREIRKAFVAPRGFRLLSADYSQIELRLLAHLSEDPYLCDAFRSGADIHRSTAARIFGVSEDSVDGAMRARAKTVNFGVLYGMGAQRLGRALGIAVKEAARFIEEYYAKLPGVKRYLDESVARARQRGYAETILGRRRPLPNLHSVHPRDRAAAERMAINTPVQGSAADLIKMAMIRLSALLAKRHPRTRLLLQVHDELILEVPHGEVTAVAELVRAEMSGVRELRVPLLVDTGVGRNWYEAHA